MRAETRVFKGRDSIPNKQRKEGNAENNTHRMSSAADRVRSPKRGRGARGGRKQGHDESGRVRVEAQVITRWPGQRRGCCRGPPGGFGITGTARLLLKENAVQEMEERGLGLVKRFVRRQCAQ